MRKFAVIVAVLALILNSSAKESAKVNFISGHKPVSKKILDANRIQMTVANDGNFAHFYYDENQYLYGLKFDELYLIYSSGFWLATLQGEDTLCSYSMFSSSDFTEGTIDSDGNHFGELDSILFRVYKIHRGDTPETNPDYRDWPTEYGAPVDIFGKPLILGSQTLWCSFADTYLPTRWFNRSRPMKAEIHLTAWADEKIDNVVFMHWKMINKSHNEWQKSFAGIFIDPDMVDSHDDLIGSDSTLNMVYCYESKIRQYEKTYQAVGYILLETPAIPSPGDTAFSYGKMKINFRNVPAASPMMYKHAPWEWTERVFFSEECTAKMVYDRLNCKDRYGSSMFDPTTGTESRWAFSGDPVSRTGWQDDSLGHDRRMMLSTGPFNVAPGDTNGMTLAILAVRDSSDRINCVLNLKNQARALHSSFRKGFGLFINAARTYAGKQNLKIPISIFNSKNLQKVDFKLIWDDENLELDTLLISDQIPGFTLDYQQSGKSAYCSIRCGPQTLSPGKYELVNAVFQVRKQINSSQSDLLVSQIHCFDDASNDYQISDARTIIRFYELPSAPTLFFPLNESYVDNLTIEFRWGAACGHEYAVSELIFPNEKLAHLNRIVERTETKVAIEDFIGRGVHDVAWTVKFITPDSVIASPDTFHFFIPDSSKLNILKELYTIQLPPDTSHQFNMHNSNMAVYEGKLFVFALQETREASYQRDCKVFVYNVENGDINLISQQNLGLQYEFDGFRAVTFRENYLFLFRDWSLLVYEVMPDFKLVKRSVQYENFYDGVLASDDKIFAIEAEYGSPSILNEFKINETNTLEKLASYVMTGWQYTIEKVDQLQLYYPFLYLARGKWGVFYVLEPDTIRLLAERKVEGRATAIQVQMPYIFVGTDQGVLKVYDGSNYANPKLIYSEQLARPFFQNLPLSLVNSVGNYLYIQRRWCDFISFCHLDSQKGFKFDGLVKADLALFLDEFAYIARGDKIIIYENKLITGVNERKISNAEQYALFQNYPNPFNQNTAIKFSLPREDFVELRIVNILGQEVNQLLNRKMSAGLHIVNWDGKDRHGNTVSSGIYLAILKTKSFKKVIKLAMLR